jgi:hypothetical protein
MNGQEIIDNFRLLTDEQDDLSDVEALAIAQEVIDKILNDRPWSFLVKTVTGTLDTTNTEYAMPTDFRMLTENYEDGVNMPKRVMFVGEAYEPYEWIDMAQRRLVRDTGGHVYIDFRQSIFVLTAVEATSRAYEFDYIYNPDAITVSTEPVIPTHFHKAIPKLMATLWANIDQTDKSFSYALENNAEFLDYLNEMAVQDAMNLNQNSL